MISKMTLTIGGLFFLILLATSYLSKKTSNSLSSRMFKILQLATFLMAFTEIVAGVMFEFPYSFLLTYCALRLNWAFGMIYFLVFFYYCYIISNNLVALDYSDLFKKADIALYKAKASSTERYCLYE